MMTGEVLIAALLLCGDGELRHDETIVWASATRPHILCLSLKNETLDDREKNVVLVQDLLGDLDMLRGRYRQFRSSPLLEDEHRFPDKKFIAESLAINRAIRCKLTSRLAMDLVHVEEIRERIYDIDLRYQIWDAVRDGRQDFYYITVRRDSLLLLRNLIGSENFYSGRLPSPY